jgi:hypothetical protein
MNRALNTVLTGVCVASGLIVWRLGRHDGARPSAALISNAAATISAPVSPSRTPKLAPASRSRQGQAGRPARPPTPAPDGRPPGVAGDAVVTGGPYFAHDLRTLMGKEGVSTRHLRISVTRSHLVLRGSVPTSEERDKAISIAEKHRPQQLALDERLEVGPSRPSKSTGPGDKKR